MSTARMSAARGWRRPGRPWGLPRPVERLAVAVRPAVALPVEVVLTRALRRLARARPDVFDRLGEFRQAVFLVQPTDAPIAFRIRPFGTEGRVETAWPEVAGRFDARISGPLATLLCLLDGSFDGDAAFFAREIRIEGDTGAVLALRNALEEAELTLGEVLGLPGPLRRVFDAVASRALATGEGGRG